MSESSGSAGFWKLLAAGALVLCAYQTFSKGSNEVRADNGGAASGGLIALIGVNQNAERLFVIDTAQKQLLVYEGGPNKQVKLVQTRNLDSDIATAVGDRKGFFLQFRQDGYEKEVVDTAAKLANPTTSAKRP